jgi:hypothetical protein
MKLEADGAGVKRSFGIVTVTAASKLRLNPHENDSIRLENLRGHDSFVLPAGYGGGNFQTRRSLAG